MANRVDERIAAAVPGSYPDAERVDSPTKPNGVAAAAILAAGIGAFVLGLMIVTTQALPAWSSAVMVYPPAGPLSGITILTVIAYVAALGVLISRWRMRNVNFGRIWAASLGLLALGLLGSFPPFYQLFAPH